MEQNSNQGTVLLQKNPNATSISISMLYSMKKSGLTNLLFKNEDRRDFCSYIYTKDKMGLSALALQKNIEVNSVLQKNTHNFSSPEYFSKDQECAQTGAQKDLRISYETKSLNDKKNLELRTAKNTENNVAQNTKESFEQNKKQVLPVELWPESWLKMHTRFSLPMKENTNSQVRVAWTYEGLEQDALGVANIERQAIMKKILSSLNHRKGTHSFIPYSLPHQDGLSIFAMHEGKSFFWSAMRLVKPRILLVFGSSARDVLQIPKLRPLQKVDIGALRILQMHKPETLVNEPIHFAATLAFLQDSLRMCVSK